MTKHKHQEENQTIIDLKEENDLLEIQIDQLNSDKTGLENEVNNFELELANRELIIKQLEEDLVKRDMEIMDLNETIDVLRDELARLRIE